MNDLDIPAPFLYFLINTGEGKKGTRVNVFLFHAHFLSVFITTDDEHEWSVNYPHFPSAFPRINKWFTLHFFPNQLVRGTHNFYFISLSSLCCSTVCAELLWLENIQYEFGLTVHPTPLLCLMLYHFLHLFLLAGFNWRVFWMRHTFMKWNSFWILLHVIWAIGWTLLTQTMYTYTEVWLWHFD